MQLFVVPARLSHGLHIRHYLQMCVYMYVRVPKHIAWFVTRLLRQNIRLYGSPEQQIRCDKFLPLATGTFQPNKHTYIPTYVSVLVRKDVRIVIVIMCALCLFTIIVNLVGKRASRFVFAFHGGKLCQIFVQTYMPVWYKRFYITDVDPR